MNLQLSAGRASLSRRIALSLPLLCVLVAHGQQPSAASLPDAPAPAHIPAQSADNALATVAGEVRTAQGSLVSSAVVTLSSADRPAREAVTDIDGRFTFQNLPPGAFTLSVALPGFTPATADVTLQPGQTLAVTPLILRLATVAVVETVVPTEVLAEQQLHAQEQQRILGFVPNFFVSYIWETPPLSSKQKFTLAAKTVWDPGNLLLSGAVAGFQQATNEFSGYHQGAAGYGKRYGADLANLVAGTFLGGAVLPSIFHQDPRYFYKGTGTVSSRTWYALSTAVVTRGDNGHRQPAFSRIFGDLAAGGLSNLYYPATNRHGVALTFENGALGIAGEALNGLVQEFLLPHFTPSLKKKQLPPAKH